jgi:hypothetical protein
MMHQKYVSVRISKDDAGAASIFYGEFCFAVLTGDATLKEKKDALVACNTPTSWQVHTNGS